MAIVRRISIRIKRNMDFLRVKLLDIGTKEKITSIKIYRSILIDSARKLYIIQIPILYVDKIIECLLQNPS